MEQKEPLLTIRQHITAMPGTGPFYPHMSKQEFLEIGIWVSLDCHSLVPEEQVSFAAGHL